MVIRKRDRQERKGEIEGETEETEIEIYIRSVARKDYWLGL